MGKSHTQSELSAALATCRSAFISIAVFSGMSNILMLTGSIFMLEVYDRVLPSHSVPTLVALTILATSMYVALGILDLIRGRILVRIGAKLDEAVSDRVYDAVVRSPLKGGDRGDGLQSLRHLDNLRSFLSGIGPIALFDLPWIPLYLIICFAFHTLIGLTALFGAVILCVLTMLTEAYTRESSKQALGLGVARNSLAETSRRNAEALVAMGMSRRMADRWRQTNRKYIATQQQTSDTASGFASTSKVLRMVLAISRACSGRLPRYQPASHRRHHYCQLYLECTRARTCRFGYRALEGLHCRPAELALAQSSFASVPDPKRANVTRSTFAESHN